MAEAASRATDPCLHVTLRMQASLSYRPVAISLVGSLVDVIPTHNINFRNDVVTAFGEAFNNVVIHGYKDRSDGILEVEAELGFDRITLHIIDNGREIDFSHLALPDFDALPESGMGIFMISALVDDLRYTSGGERNVLTLIKRTNALGPIDRSHPSPLTTTTEDRPR